jgi:hypothetical protein
MISLETYGKLGGRPDVLVILDITPPFVIRVGPPNVNYTEDTLARFYKSLFRRDISGHSG